MKVTPAQRKALGFAASTGGYNPHGAEWRTAEKLEAAKWIVRVKVPGQTWGLGQFAITMEGAKILLENGQQRTRLLIKKLTPAQYRALAAGRLAGGFMPYGGSEHSLADRLVDQGLLRHSSGHGYVITDAGRQALRREES